jgi:hypothetical protein
MEVGWRGKDGSAFFAVNHPEPPKDVIDLYAKIAAWLLLLERPRGRAGAH